ncbi:glutathione synthase [Lipomyces japonicus]|uniref:glutathione synthase n=1 Tax=Lipomyces japonicus TaxID=56871 RepID=UPI0034CF42B1
MVNGTEYPPVLTSQQESELLFALKDWALTHGLVIRSSSANASAEQTESSALATPVPLTLFPSPYPKSLLQHARSIQPLFNDLYVKIADDLPFLDAITANLAKVDTFSKDLYRIYKEVEAEGGPGQDLSLGIFRSDYLLHSNNHDDDDNDDGSGSVSLRQVELNTIAASFMGLSSRASDLHRFLHAAGYYPEGNILSRDADLPENPAARQIARGLGLAAQAYGVKESIVLFIVQPGERNAFDQRWLEYHLLNDFKIRVARASLDDAFSRATVDPETKVLRYDGDEVSVVYYRSGYSPDDYPTPNSWQARKKLELSKAIKSPSLATQFAGAKKVQQVLVDDSVLSNYVDGESKTLISDTFTEILPLDNSDKGQRARELIATRPQDFVLKPQREGGGNNVYKEKIPEFLKSLGDEELWKGYILMELIKPPSDAQNSIVRAGEVKSAQVISELGIYGIVLWDSKTHQVKQNFEAGWLVRTKFADSEEGGVAAGFGSIDSLVLV